MQKYTKNYHKNMKNTNKSAIIFFELEIFLKFIFFWRAQASLTIKGHVSVVIYWPAQISKGISLKHQPVTVIVGVLSPSTTKPVLKVAVAGRRTGSGRDGDVVDKQLGSLFSPPLDADGPLLVLFKRSFRVDVGVEVSPRSLSSPLYWDFVAILGFPLSSFLDANTQEGRFWTCEQIKCVNAGSLSTWKAVEFSYFFYLFTCKQRSIHCTARVFRVIQIEVKEGEVSIFGACRVIPYNSGIGGSLSLPRSPNRGLEGAQVIFKVALCRIVDWASVVG